MRSIDTDTLKERLAQGDRLWLVHDPQCGDFRRQHLPGAILFTDIEQASRVLRPHDVIVVYGTDKNCQTTRVMASRLAQLGYSQVYLYQGGLKEWNNTGGPIEGTG